MRANLERTQSLVDTDFAPGKELVVFHADGHRIASFICYEAVFPHLVRRFAAAGAEVLVNISNDGYFGRSAARDQHLKIARMRAAENRRWILLHAAGSPSSIRRFPVLRSPTSSPEATENWEPRTEN